MHGIVYVPFMTTNNSYHIFASNWLWLCLFLYDTWLLLSFYVAILSWFSEQFFICLLFFILLFEFTNNAQTNCCNRNNSCTQNYNSLLHMNTSFFSSFFDSASFEFYVSHFFLVSQWTHNRFPLQDTDHLLKEQNQSFFEHWD